jgi:hypothetical protein
VDVFAAAIKLLALDNFTESALELLLATLEDRCSEPAPPTALALPLPNVSMLLLPIFIT